MSAAEVFAPVEEMSGTPELRLVDTVGEASHQVTPEAVPYLGPTALELLGMINPNGTAERPAGFGFLLSYAPEQ